jgi:hypothetical protein
MCPHSHSPSSCNALACSLCEPSSRPRILASSSHFQKLSSDGKAPELRLPEPRTVPLDVLWELPGYIIQAISDGTNQLCVSDSLRVTQPVQRLPLNDDSLRTLAAPPPSTCPVLTLLRRCDALHTSFIPEHRASYSRFSWALIQMKHPVDSSGTAPAHWDPHWDPHGRNGSAWRSEAVLCHCSRS